MSLLFTSMIIPDQLYYYYYFNLFYIKSFVCFSKIDFFFQRMEYWHKNSIVVCEGILFPVLPFLVLILSCVAVKLDNFDIFHYQKLL